MAKRITITEANAPPTFLAEAFARLLFERNKTMPAPALSLVTSKPVTAGYKLPAHDQSRPLPPVV
ncbi:MAG: hypothetical protein N2690_01145 [Rhodocyclaceae bacterium]|nr:hypothetical protein [Rhodocyclaceae bacterium]